MKQRDLRHLRSKVPKGPIKDRAHLARVASQMCLICRTPYVVVHHIRECHPRTMGVRVGDDQTVPLCVLHHDELHTYNNTEFWTLHGVNAKAWAEAFYAETLRQRQPRR